MKPSRTSAHRAGTIAALATLLLAAACGGGGGGKATSASTPSTASPTSSPGSSTTASTEVSGAAFATLSGQDIADSSKADMLTLDAVHYTGDITSGGSEITLDIQAKANGDCTGTVGIKGGKATVLSAGGQSWFKGDDAFWKATVGDQAEKIITAVGDKWVLDSDNNFSQFCDLDKFFDGLFSATGTTKSTYKTAGTSTVDGQKVVAVARTNASDGNSTGYVLIDGKHYLVKIERTSGSDAGKLEFADFNQDFQVTAPAADDTVDPATLG